MVCIFEEQRKTKSGDRKIRGSQGNLWWVALSRCCRKSRSPVWILRFYSLGNFSQNTWTNWLLACSKVSQQFVNSHEIIITFMYMGMNFLSFYKTLNMTFTWKFMSKSLLCTHLNTPDFFSHKDPCIIPEKLTQMSTMFKRIRKKLGSVRPTIHPSCFCVILLTNQQVDTIENNLLSWGYKRPIWKSIWGRNIFS